MTLSHVLEPATAVLCGYETVAIATRRLPTVSSLCARHRWLPVIIVSGLAWHVRPRQPVRR